MNINNGLKEQKVSAEAYDAELLMDHLLEEMERGLNRESSSLAMIPAHVGTGGDVPSDKSVAVIDAGGTNLRICLARFDAEKKLQISLFSKQPMPGRDHEQTAAEFYAVLADALAPLKDEFDQIGFCFSYPATILPNFDGRLLH